MRKLYLLVVFTCCLSINLLAKSFDTGAADTLNNYNEKADLPLLGKLWGFLKYHHPGVTNTQLDWDKQLINVLPAYMNNTDKTGRDRILWKWINDLGAAPVYPVKDSSITNLVLKPDLSWINAGNFSPDILKILINLTHNHTKGNQRYVKFIADDDVVIPSFANEQSYSQMKFPDYPYRLLAAYRYWNMVAYFYPYRRLAKQNWDKNLKLLTHGALTARTEAEYARFIQSMIASIGDSHAVIRSGTLEQARGRYKAPFGLKMIQGKAVVSTEASSIPTIKRGYILQSVNGIAVSNIVAGLKPYVSASTDAAFMREVAGLVTRTNDSVSNVVLTDNGKQYRIKIKNIPYTNFIPESTDFPYQKDSSYFVMQANILYINVGGIKREQIASLKPILKKVNGVIFDGRQYPRGGAAVDLYSELFLPHSTAMGKFSTLVEGYQGSFKMSKQLTFGADNPDYYKGKVAIVVNENTQSTGEFFAMYIKTLPNAVVVGSETSGADGNVTQIFALPGGFYTQFTGLGVYYPDGRATQQIGIIPDVKVNQTIKGYINGKDELLDKAVEVLSKL